MSMRDVLGDDFIRRYFTPPEVVAKCLICGRLYSSFEGRAWGVCSRPECQERREELETKKED